MTRSTLHPGRPWVVILLIILCCIPELTLLGADWGFWGSARWRPLAYQNGAFWNGLLIGWRPNFAAQPYTMFGTYAFLHGGFIHLAVNMLTLYSLGLAIVQRAGQLQLVIIYVTAILGGAVGFALLGTIVAPMVGASGALFGLAGAWVIWGVWEVMRIRPGLKSLAYAILWPTTFLILLNVIMYWATDGKLAWQTHLGGFVAGAAVAIILIKFSKPPMLLHDPEDGK